MSYRDYTSAIDILKVDGHAETVGTPEVTILAVDSSNNVLLAKGATVPTDDDNGYAVGSLFIDTTGGVGVTLYINEGDADDCDFNAVETPGAAITGVTAGTDLTGGGTSGTVTLNLDTTITQPITFSAGTSIVFGTAVGNTYYNPYSDGVGTAAAVFRFLGFNNAFGTATGTAFSGNAYNIAIQVPGIGTAYIKATDAA